MQPHSLSAHLYNGCDPDTCLTGSLWVLTRLYEQQGGTHCTTAVNSGCLHRVKLQWGFPCGSVSKESTAMRETWVRPLGWEDPLEKGKAIHSSILAWKIP